MSKNEILQNEETQPNPPQTEEIETLSVTIGHSLNSENEPKSDESSSFNLDDFTNNSEDFINYSNLRSESNANSRLNSSKKPSNNNNFSSDDSTGSFIMSNISTSSEDKLLLSNPSNRNQNAIETDSSSRSTAENGFIESASSSIKSTPARPQKKSINIQKARSPGNFKSEAIKRAIAKKNNLQAQFNIISIQRRQLIEQENDLKSKIDSINEKSGEIMMMLDNKKDILINENDELRSQYEKYPSVEYLSKQLAILSEILETVNDNDDDFFTEYDEYDEYDDKSSVSSGVRHMSKKKRVLDENTMRKIGVLQKSTENLSILPERLNYLVNRLETMKTALESLTPKKPKVAANNGNSNESEQTAKTKEEEKEKKELMRKIKLLKISMNASFNRTQFQCENLQTDVQRLINECETIKSINNNLPKLRRSRSRQSTPIKPLKNGSATEELFFKINDIKSNNNNMANTANSSVNTPIKIRLGVNLENDVLKFPIDSNPNDSNSFASNGSDSSSLSEEEINKYKEGYALSALSRMDIFDKDVKHMLKAAGGDFTNLHFNGNNEYEYNNFRFKVSKKDNKLYASSDGDTILLPIFLSNIVYL